MFTALTLSMALGAPVPAPAAPVPTGVAPQVMELKADAEGKVVVSVRRAEQVQLGGVNRIAPAGGGAAAPAVVTRSVVKQVELGEVKDLTITTADGKKLETEEAVKKIAGGAIVVVSGDGRPVSPAYLKVFKDDTLVLASPELAGTLNRPIARPLPANVNGGVQILPAGPGGNVQILPAQGGVIQLQVAPAILPAAPPVPVEKPLPPKNDK